jgi:polyphosphate glucokinase
MSHAESGTWPDDIRTLAVDVGGSGIKASVLDAEGAMTTERVRVATPYPCPPPTLVATITDLVAGLPDFGRVSVGFPGLIREGVVRNIPSLSRTAYDGPTDPELVAQWHGFALAETLGQAFDRPTLVVNDADMQGCAVARGDGFEFVLTLGTGAGTALFFNGRLLPHLELGHAPFRKGDTVEQQIGNVARKAVGNTEWTKRVLKAIKAYDRYLFFDHIYLGGGNAKHLQGTQLPDNAVIVPNTAGITGGVRVWELATA